jgi:diacylglycerol O-acyltransferase / wax synthase
MRQLTSLDAQFLAIESSTHYGHVGGLVVLDPSTRESGELRIEDVTELIAERIHLLPVMRWKLAEVPLGLDRPYWIEDTEFDLEYHLREIALPSPGDDRRLAEQVTRITSRHLDRSRPLWELYLIQGLENGRCAILTKMHHAMIDGMSGAEIMGLLLDVSPDGRALVAPDSDGDTRSGTPGRVEMLGRAALGVPRYPLRALKALPSAVPNIADTSFGVLPGAGTVGRLAGGAARVLRGDSIGFGRARPGAPRTSFNGKVSAHRRFAFGRLSLDDVKAIKNAYGTTVNDVVVSVCAGAVRRWLEAHDELTDEPLIAQVPVSVRTEEQSGTYGNRILLMDAPLHTEVADPVDRLRATHESLREMKERRGALPADLLQDVNHFIPPAVFARAAQLSLRLATRGPGRPAWNLVISNVPGAQAPLYCAGAKLLSHHPVSVITDGLGLNITVMSYCGMLDVGIVADREQMPDVWDLMGSLEDELAALLP